MHLLIIEDDLDLGRALQQALRAEGVSSEWRRRAADAPRRVDASEYDCVLLDLTLPDGFGLELLSAWRRAGDTLPVIVITAREALEDRLAGLDGGADDFIIKPFATAELVSRVRAVLRRYAQQASEVWRIGELQVEPRAHVARLGGQPLELSPRGVGGGGGEAGPPPPPGGPRGAGRPRGARGGGGGGGGRPPPAGRRGGRRWARTPPPRDPSAVVPKGQLSQRLAPLGEPVEFGALEVHVSNLRRKIGGQRIRTVRGVGYQLLAC